MKKCRGQLKLYSNCFLLPYFQIKFYPKRAILYKLPNRDEMRKKIHQNIIYSYVAPKEVRYKSSYTHDICQYHCLLFES